MENDENKSDPQTPPDVSTQPGALRLQAEEPVELPTRVPNSDETAVPAFTQPGVAEAVTANLAKKKTLSISIKDKAVLYAAYMPFLKSGGLFIPTKKPFVMGENCSLVISLLDEDNKHSVTGKVVWITPSGSPTNKAAGIGIEFAETTDGELVRRKIEDILGVMLKSDNATHTM